MIKVLQNWEEIGDAYGRLRANHLPTHSTVEKNWDLFQLQGALSEVSHGARILDAGCGGCHTLDFLSGAGFDHLEGVDLTVSLSDRRAQLRQMLHRSIFRLPYRLHRQDLTKTSYRSSSFDVVTSVSVVEHGVSLSSFFGEAIRLLVRDGVLLITTDYWHSPITLPPETRVFGLPWKIYSEEDVKSLIRQAYDHGFRLVDEGGVPPCDRPCVFWGGVRYTFIFLAFVKR